MAAESGSLRGFYVRSGLLSAGEVAIVGGVAGWIVGWRYGHWLITLGLLLMVVGLWPVGFRVRRSLAGAYVRLGQSLKGQSAAYHYRKFAAKHPEQAWRFALTLDWQRDLLRGLDRHAEAEPVAREAVETWRDVVTIDPSRAEELSRALNKLTVTLSALKRADELVPLTEEATVVQRSLVAEQEKLLALHLSNLAVGLQNKRQWEAALPAAEEAATLYRRLVPVDPDQLEQAADTAEGLATTLRRLDRPLDSLQTTREWVEYERTLAARRPDRRPQLAEALRVLGSRSANLDHVDDGITSWHEALDLWRQLASQGDEHRSAYADACNLIGHGLGVVGESTESLTVLRTGLDVRRMLAALDSRQYDDLLDDLGRATETSHALEFAAEAVAVVRDHTDALTAHTLASASERLRDAGFTAEADELSARRS
ncbi:tetratricopeptide repeat protein [Kribbella speibonae]|uniref:Tetratricopeptide repeat protein n=1 Tax=Kribbella speibonae TaxID=1572660 RepID=A0A4V2M4Y6_9ACTN|nr:tetratricopeptide repeat protein [Kribbella speibonae]TCC37782.1 tetratricopeptide repeat protein [Kribbella speibonae]